MLVLPLDDLPMFCILACADVMSSYEMAASHGFEPRYAESESAVLPLDDKAINISMSSFTAPLDYVPVGKNHKNREIYELTRAITYYVGSLEDPFWAVTAPVGFVTDLATIPWPFRLIFKPNGRYAPAAVIHDYMLHLYHDNRGTTFSRLVIDAIFYESMLVLGVSRITASILYYGVRAYAIWTGQQ